MKKIITLVFMSAVLALTSCNDFLDKYPKYGVDPFFIILLLYWLLVAEDMKPWLSAMVPSVAQQFFA